MKVEIQTEPATIRAEYPPMKIQWLKGKGITKQILSDMYLSQQMSSVEIGKYFEVSPQTVCNKIKNFGISRRPFADQLEGQKFSRWTVIKRVENGKGGHTKWLCRCECGSTGTPTTGSLKSGGSKSCGCLIIESARSRNGTNHPSYKNGRTNKEGYVLITDRTHPNANKRGRILEHTVVMSKYLGRPIIPGESIHHKNGIRDDNRIENLELWNRKHGSGIRTNDMIEFCTDYLKQYAPQKLIRELRCG